MALPQMIHPPLLDDPVIGGLAKEFSRGAALRTLPLHRCQRVRTKEFWLCGNLFMRWLRGRCIWCTWNDCYFFGMVAARARVPGSSPLSQLNLHETDEAKVVFTKQKRSISVARPEKKRIKAKSHFFMPLPIELWALSGIATLILLKSFHAGNYAKTWEASKRKQQEQRKTKQNTKHKQSQPKKTPRKLPGTSMVVPSCKSIGSSRTSGRIFFL